MKPVASRIVPPILIAMSLAACGRSPSPEGPPTAPERPAPERASDAAAGSVLYACDDGAAIEITADGLKAIVSLEDGRKVSLPRAESASKGGGDVFVGDAFSVLRQGHNAQLHRDGDGSADCTSP